MNIGIKQGYPRISKISWKLSAYIQLMRPFTIFPAFMAGVFGILTQLAYHGQLNIAFTEWSTIIYAAVTLAFGQAIGQICNQVADAELDKVIKPYRPIPRGLISRDEAMGIAWILAFFTIARAFTINILFGLLITNLVFFAVFYNLQPFRPRSHTWISLIWLAFSRGFLPWLTMWVVFGSSNDVLPWFLGLLGFTWVLSFQSTKDLVDVEGDKKFGIKTLPVVYGLDGARDLMILMASLFFLPLILGIATGFLPISFLLLLSVQIIVFGIIIQDLFNPREIPFMENTVSWIAYYLGLSSLYFFSFLCFSI